MAETWLLSLKSTFST